jgi:hypothetical protein
MGIRGFNGKGLGGEEKGGGFGVLQGIWVGYGVNAYLWHWDMENN